MSTSNFFLKYPHIIQQTGNENAQTYWLEVMILKSVAVTGDNQQTGLGCSKLG